MPKLLIELSGVEYDRLCAMARRERRTPNAQAAVVIGTTMEALSRRGDLTDPVAEALEDLDEGAQRTLAQEREERAAG